MVGRTAERAERTAAALAAQGHQARAAGAEEACARADSPPLFEVSWVRPGTHLSCMVATPPATSTRSGVTLRSHVTTAKSLDVAVLLHEGGRPCPVAVSTLAEAKAFDAGGYTGITCATGINPHKLPRVVALLRRARSTVTVTAVAAGPKRPLSQRSAASCTKRAAWTAC